MQYALNAEMRLRGTTLSLFRCESLIVLLVLSLRSNTHTLRSRAKSMVTVLTNLCKKETNNSTEVDVVNIAQCFTLEAFGKLALGHDFLFQ